MKSSFQALLLPVVMYSQIIMVRSKVPFWQLLNIGRNVLVISTCITCDITFPELLKVDFNIQYFDRMLLKRCQDFFGVLFWFSYAPKKILHITGCFEILEGGGGVMWKYWDFEKTVSYKSSICFQAQKKRAQKRCEVQTSHCVVVFTQAPQCNMELNLRVRHRPINTVFLNFRIWLWHICFQSCWICV